MAYPDDQNGIPIPKINGWYAIDWNNEPLKVGDVTYRIGGQTKRLLFQAMGASTNSGNIGKTPLDAYGTNTGESYMTWRRVKKTDNMHGWIRLGEDEVLCDKDVITTADAHPDASFAGISYAGLEEGGRLGYANCHRIGWGNGGYTLASLRENAIAKIHHHLYHSAWRYGDEVPVSSERPIAPRRKTRLEMLGPNHHFKKALPLP